MQTESERRGADMSERGRLEELRVRRMVWTGRALGPQLHFQLGADSPAGFDPVGNWRPLLQHDCDHPANCVTPHTGLWSSSLRPGATGPTSAFWEEQLGKIGAQAFCWELIPAPHGRVLRIDDRYDYDLALRHYPDAHTGGLNFAALAADFDLLHLTAHGAACSHPLSRKAPYEWTLWLRPLFARAPRLIHEYRARYFASIHLDKPYLGQYLQLRGPTPRVMRVIRELEACARGCVSDAEAEPMRGTRALFDDMIVGHVIRDRRGEEIHTVGAGLFDELMRRDPGLARAIGAKMFVAIERCRDGKE